MIEMPLIAVRRYAALLAAAILAASAAPAAQAAFACYKVTDAGSGADFDAFVGLVTQPVGNVAKGLAMHEVHGKHTVPGAGPEKASAKPRSSLEMSLITGTVLVASGKGAQMSILRNFGRGEGGITGNVVLDCGATSDRPAPKTWICRGIAASDDLNSKVVSARDIRLTRIARTTPECGEVALRSD